MWECQRCTFENTPSSTECEICYQARYGYTTSDVLSWQCSNCCQFNQKGLTECSVCNHSRKVLIPDDRDKNKPLARPTNESEEKYEDAWICKKKISASTECGSINASDVYHCSKCKAIKPYFPVTVKSSSDLKLKLTEDFLRPVISSDPKGDWQHDDLAVLDTNRHREMEWSGENTRPKSFTSAEYQSYEPASQFSHEWSAEDRGKHQKWERSTDQFATMSLRDSGELCEPEDLGFPDSECRMVLVGKTGNGKSTLANTLLGLDRFKSSSSFSSATKKCQRHRAKRFGIHLEVVDTPGLFDTDLDQEAAMTEIVKCFGIVSPGPHAVVLVLRIGVRFTKEESMAVEEVYRLFGVQLLRFLVVVFTHGDTLEKNTTTTKEDQVRAMLDNSPDNMKMLIGKVNHRFVVFDNTASKTEKSLQVKFLLQTIIHLLKVNGGRPFTNKLFEKVELRMQEREKELADEILGCKGMRVFGKGSSRHQLRDIIRDEVAHEGLLMHIIQKLLLPLLPSALGRLIPILIRNAVTLAASSICSLQ